MAQQKQSTVQIIFNDDDIKLHRQLKAKCALEGTTMQGYVLELIRKDLEKDK